MANEDRKKDKKKRAPADPPDATSAQPTASDPIPGTSKGTPHKFSRVRPSSSQDNPVAEKKKKTELEDSRVVSFVAHDDFFDNFFILFCYSELRCCCSDPFYSVI